MASIVPEPADRQDENAHHVCPSCGKVPKSVVTRITGVGTLNADCLCPLGHVWSVHWLGAA